MNTLIFQTNYHTFVFNSFDGGTEKVTSNYPKKIENPRKSCRTGCDGIAVETEKPPFRSRNRPQKGGFWLL